MNRRALLVATLASLPMAALSQSAPVNISPPEAHKLAADKKAVLVDIRRPDEWADTGVPEHAVKIDMEDPRFLAKLSAATGNDRTRPVALICHAANRSRAVQQALARHGYTRVINVEGGVAGNAADRGWVARGLPVTRVR
jgi:rhodanese-related sulfurtransferase